MSPIPTDSVTALPLASVDPVKLANIISQRCNNGSAPGPSGWTGHHLHTLMQDEECKLGITALLTDICNARFESNDIRRRLLASVLIPASKPNHSIRPIAMGEVFYKATGHYVM